MAAEIGLLSMTQIQKLSQSQHHINHPSLPLPLPLHHNQHQQQNPKSTTIIATPTARMMWNPRESQQPRHQEEDDSWEVRAFAEDTRNIMGTTWPPRSYTCTFCKREFRSAQALGGHMNVHRRDRARLHQALPPPPLPTISTSQYHTPTFINVPPQELAANAGLCFLYHLPSPNNTVNNADGGSPNNFLSISSSSSSRHQNNSLMMMQSTVGINGVSSSYCYSNNNNNSSSKVVEEEQVASSVHLEELDLELRLGHKPTPT